MHRWMDGYRMVGWIAGWARAWTRGVTPLVSRVVCVQGGRLVVHR